VFIFIATFQQIKYSTNYSQGPQHISTTVYFYHREYQNVQVIMLSSFIHSIGWPNCKSYKKNCTTYSKCKQQFLL